MNPPPRRTPALVPSAFLAATLLASALLLSARTSAGDDPDEAQGSGAKADEADEAAEGAEEAKTEEAKAEETKAEEAGAAEADEPKPKKEKKSKKAKKPKSKAKVLLPVSAEGAEVFLDGDKVGVAPIGALTGLAIGLHTLEVRMDGFYPYSAELDVPAEGMLRHDVMLSGGASKKVKLPPLLKKWWFWTAVGAVVLAGVAVGIYFAVRAEEPDAIPLPPY